MKKKIIALVGLPRSGTTLTSAIFEVHPKIGTIFEPWNTTKNETLEPWESEKDILSFSKHRYGVNYSDMEALFFKETSTSPNAISWTQESLLNLQKLGHDIKIIWIIRDINHAYLSRVHTAREWWGHPDMKIETESFKNFNKFAFNSFLSILEMSKKFDSCIISYEKLVSNTQRTLSDLMSFIGIDLHSNQLEYHKYFNKHKSAGDPEVTNNPKPISINKITQKDSEWNEYKDVFLKALNENELEIYNKMMKIVHHCRKVGFEKGTTNANL